MYTIKLSNDKCNKKVICRIIIVINILDLAWGSNLARIILDLEKLGSKRLVGEVPPDIFFQLKNIFQILETLGSARIEGNNTTLAEYIEKLVEQLPSSQVDEAQKEIQNLEIAIQWIEDNTDEKTVFTQT